MKGFVALTSDNWCHNLVNIKAKEAVFWRKRLQFRALDEGDKFYFLNRKIVGKERYIVGSAQFVKFEILPAIRAWEQYGEFLGSKSIDSFLEEIDSIYKDTSINIGCVVLKNVYFFKKPVTLKACGVDFSPYIVSGKKVTDIECCAIDSKLLEGENKDG